MTCACTRSRKTVLPEFADTLMRTSRFPDIEVEPRVDDGPPAGWDQSARALAFDDRRTINPGAGGQARPIPDGRVDGNTVTSEVDRPGAGAACWAHRRLGLGIRQFLALDREAKLHDLDRLGLAAI